jgi:basic membrane protein A
MVAGTAEAERGRDITIAQVEPLIDAEEDLRDLADSGVGLIIVSRDFDLELERVAPDYPDVRFVAIDPVALHTELPNLTKIHFAVEDSAFLAGAAAAMTSQTGVVGFVGGLQTLPSEQSRTGFEQGARFWAPEITVLSMYVGPVENPRATARIQPDLAYDVATSIYTAGADVIFHDAGESGTGVVRAAREVSTGNRLWVIGSDIDEYQNSPSEIDRSHVLSSTIKRYDTAVTQAVNAFFDGSLESGDIILGLNEQGVGLSRSGGHLSEIDGVLKNLDGDVAFGHINVFSHSLVGPRWHLEPDLTVRLDLTESGCTAEIVGAGVVPNGRIRMQRGSVIAFELTNRTDGVGGLALRNIAPEVSLSDLAEEAQFGIPASYQAVLAISLVEPGGSTSMAALMSSSPFVPNCLLFESTTLPFNFAPLIASPGA